MSDIQAYGVEEILSCEEIGGFVIVVARMYGGAEISLALTQEQYEKLQRKPAPRKETPPMEDQFEIIAKDKSLIRHGQQKAIKDSKITVHGQGSTVTIGRGGTFRNANLLIEASDSHIEIAEDVTFTGSIFIKGQGSSRVRIGKGSTFGNVTIICSEGTNFTCGEDCMFAWAIECRTTDSHGIYDRKTRERINKPQDIRVGSHVWIAAKTTMMKGTVIPDGCILGMGSFTHKAFDIPNSIIAGNPARILKEDVYWERPLLG